MIAVASFESSASLLGIGEIRLSLDDSHLLDCAWLSSSAVLADFKFDALVV
jgi:hypothetical protein